jgi:hypothetical protein
MSHLCQLTNDIHPIFKDENLCFCPEVIKASDYWFDKFSYCMAPHFADNPNELRGLVTYPQPALPLPRDNIVMRTILQLASRMITHDQTLPFWAGIINAVTGEGDDAKVGIIKVHPRRRLNQVRKERTLRKLREFGSDRVRFHSKAFLDVNGDRDEGKGGFTGPQAICEPDPLYEVCERTGESKYYGYRDGKRTIEDRKQAFRHIVINLRRQMLQPLVNCVGMTVSELQLELFSYASTICHELSHALAQYYVDGDIFETPPVNDEILVETGLSLESFLFGGIPHFKYDGYEPLALLQWPCQGMCDEYAQGGSQPMDCALFGDAGPDRFIPVDPRKVEVFFLQSFWDDSNPPVGCWKKMWLKPHVNMALDEDDFDHFNTGDTAPFLPEPKRRRFSDATKDRQRVRKANERWKKRNEVRFRWHRSKDISEERKAEFHEQEMERLNELWVECLRGI